jgi:hypothetical protein
MSSIQTDLNNHNYIFTFPASNLIVPFYTTTMFPSSSNLNLSPGLKAGIPLYGHVPHLNESPK